MFLIFINKIGTTWDSENIYEFLFSDDITDVDGEFWDKVPAGGNPEPPKPASVKKVGRLNTSLDLDVIQDSDTFAMWDSIDGLIALGWENIDEYEEYPDNRLYFGFGSKLEDVEKKLLAKDNALVFINKENIIKD